MLAIDYDYMTYEDFLSYNEFDNRKMEYYSGEIICMSPTHPKHNLVQNKLYLQLVMSLNDCSKCEVYTSDVAVKFELADEKYQFEPDLMVVCDDNFDKAIYTGTPKLVVEVLSRTTQHRDIGIKLDVYEKCGISEYWIADINNQEIKVYSHNVNGRFKSIITYTVNDQINWNDKQIKLSEVIR